MRIMMLLVVAVVAVAAPPRVSDPRVWNADAAHDALIHCPPKGRLDCVAEVMARQGASAEAVAFSRATGWFLVRVRALGGPVKLATLVNPWRANENQQPALIDGAPAVVPVENPAVPVEHSKGFVALKARHPQAMWWGSSPDLERVAHDRAGQRVTFRYRILDGCHACAVVGWARVRFDFRRDGSFVGARLLSIEEAMGPRP